MRICSCCSGVMRKVGGLMGARKIVPRIIEMIPPAPMIPKLGVAISTIRSATPRPNKKMATRFTLNPRPMIPRAIPMVPRISAP